MSLVSAHFCQHHWGLLGPHKDSRHGRAMTLQLESLSIGGPSKNTVEAEKHRLFSRLVWKSFIKIACHRCEHKGKLLLTTACF